MTDAELNYQIWLELAEDDLAVAKQIITARERYCHIAVYHLHQAAEKYLKAFMVKSGRTIIRTHDLPRLLEECMKINQELSRMVEPISYVQLFLPKTR